MELLGKSVAVLGAGASGRAAGTLARSRGARVTVYDSGDSEKLRSAVATFAERGIPLVSGRSALEQEKTCDLAVISPGIPGDSDLARTFTSRGIELIGEIEFAWRLGNAPTIAITGTNGKTTTTGLIAAILNGAGKRTVATGNIGYAFSELIESGRPCDWYVVEVSSFQLETIAEFRPAVAVWLNFAPDHMDRYRTVEEYREAKLRIFENQGGDDLAVIKEEERIGTAARQVTFSAFAEGADFQFRDGWILGPGEERLIDFRTTRLNGRHNAENVMAAMAAAQAAGIAYSEMGEAIRQFTAPPHRCEVVARLDGVTWVNDSKATNLHAVESSLRGQDQPVVLLAGGKEKGLDVRELNGCIERHVRSAVCYGENAARLIEAWSPLVPCREAPSLEEAVRCAAAIATDGDCVLLSPGTSSFDMFSGYEERGEVFRRAVESIRDVRDAQAESLR